MPFKTWTNPSAPPESSWTEGWRRADIGAANGHGNARSLARIQSVVACGGEVDRRITFAYVMNKMAPGGGVIAAALAERVKDIVNR